MISKLKELKEWRDSILGQLKLISDPQLDKYTWLCGQLSVLNTLISEYNHEGELE